MNVDNPHIETGDSTGALQDWRVRGATAENTDRGRLYVDKDSGNLRAFKDYGVTLVAQGPDVANGDAVLVAQNGSGLEVTVYRNAANVVPVTLYVWLCSEQDLRENADDLQGLLLSNETDFGVCLKQSMREFLARFSAKWPPPPSHGAPLRWSPSYLEAGSHGDQEIYASDYWSLNRRGQWEITGLQNPDDYREWGIQQTLAKIYHRRARTHDESDPWFSRFISSQREANRLWKTIKANVDSNRDGIPERATKTRSVRIRRG